MYYETTGPLQAVCNSQRLDRAETQGQIARPHRDLLPAQFTFLLQLGQRLVNHGEQLQDDGRSDVRHDAEGKDRHSTNIAARKQVHKTKQRAPILIDVLPEHLGVNARNRDVPANAVHGQQRQREQNALAKVGNSEDV